MREKKWRRRPVDVEKVSGRKWHSVHYWMAPQSQLFPSLRPASDFYSERLFNCGALDQEVASHLKYKYKYEVVDALDWVAWYSKYKYKYKTVDALD